MVSHLRFCVFLNGVWCVVPAYAYAVYVLDVPRVTEMCLLLLLILLL